MACAVGGAGSLTGRRTGASCARVRAARGPRRRQGPRAATCPRGRRGNGATTTTTSRRSSCAGCRRCRLARQAREARAARGSCCRGRCSCAPDGFAAASAWASEHRPRGGRATVAAAARPATRQCPRLVARRRPSAAAAARAAEHGAAGPQRPAAPQPCTSRAWPRLRSTRARAASVGRSERAAAEDGGRGWEAARRQPVPQSTGVGGMRAPRSPSRQQASFFFSLAPWRLLFALETLTSSPAARQRRSGRRPPAQQLGVGACASDQRSCRLPTRKRRPGSAGRETRSLATAVTRPPSSVASCAPALRESRETQADPTTSKRRWRHARDRPRLLAPRPPRSTTTGGRRDDPRARRARTRTPLLSGQRDACRGHTARAVAPGPSKQHHRPGAPK